MGKKDKKNILGCETWLTGTGIKKMQIKMPNK
jgi:hypothetical protein